MGKRHEQKCHTGRHRHGQQAHETMLHITGVTEIQIESTMRYHLTLVRMGNKKPDRKQQMLERMW